MARSVWKTDIRLARWAGWVAVGSVLASLPVHARLGDLFLGAPDDGVIDRVPMTPTSTLAIASLVLALLGGAFFASLPGHIALRRIDRSSGREKGRSHAVVGILLGHLGSLALTLLWLLKQLLSRGW